MKLPNIFQSLIRNKFTPLVVILTITFCFTLSSYPGKSCEKSDTLSVESKKIEPVKASLEPDKNKPKEECKKFNMMSLNLVYYLMNKYIGSGIENK